MSMLNAIYSRLFRRNCRIAWNSFVARNCRLGHGTRVERGAVVSDSITGRSSHIGRDCRMRGATLGDFTALAEGVQLEAGTLGNGSYVAAGSRLSGVMIGRFCSIGPEVMAGYGRHPTDRLSTHPVFYSSAPPIGLRWAKKSSFEERRPISIGHDVFIGARAFILDGVTIGNGAIIGAGAVVIHDVAPYAVVAGVPATVRRQRFPDQDIELLQRLHWWDWDWAALAEAAACLDAGNVEALRRFAEERSLP